MYFLTNLFRNFRYFMSLLGVAAAGVIVIYGSLSTAPIGIVICGCLTILPSGFIFFENYKVLRDMEKYVGKFKKDLIQFQKEIDEFKQENRDLKNNIDILGKIKDDYVLEAEKLRKLLNDADMQLDTLTELKNSYIDENNQLKDLLEHFTTANNEHQKENNKLKDMISNMCEIRDNYKKKIDELNQTIVDLESQHLKMSQLKDQYMAENNKFSQENAKLRQTLKSVENLYNKSRELLKSFIETKTLYTDISTDMAHTAEHLDSTQKHFDENITQLTHLIDLTSQRSTQSFHQMDINHDGQLTLDEYLGQSAPENNNTPFIQRTKEEFEKLDVNKDGILTPDEFIKNNTKSEKQGEEFNIDSNYLSEDENSDTF